MKNKLLPALVVLSACAGQGGGMIDLRISSLPDHPQNIVIEWHEGGGMLPEGESIYISKDSSYWYKWRNNYHQKVYFKSDTAEIQELYTVFLDYDFDQIREIEEQEVYDRGGSEITVTADKKLYGKNNSGMTFIHKDDVDSYYQIETAVYDFAISRIEGSKLPVSINLPPNKFQDGITYYLTIDGITLLADADSLFEPKSIDTLLYPGTHEIEWSVYNDDSLTYYGSPAQTHWITKLIELSDSTSTIRFSFRSGQPEILFN